MLMDRLKKLSQADKPISLRVRVLFLQKPSTWNRPPPPIKRRHRPLHALPLYIWELKWILLLVDGINASRMEEQQAAFHQMGVLCGKLVGLMDKKSKIGRGY